MSDELAPKILFAGAWIPAHEAWSKLEAVSTTADVLDRLNTDHPDLATDYTRSTVAQIRRQLHAVEVRMPYRIDQVPLMRERALALMQSESPEDVVDALEAEFGSDANIQGLLTLTGPEPYLASLRRELAVLKRNKVTSEQAAGLWNELQRLAPGGGRWTTRKIEELLDTGSE